MIKELEEYIVASHLACHTRRILLDDFDRDFNNNFDDNMTKSFNSVPFHACESDIDH